MSKTTILNSKFSIYHFKKLYNENYNNYEIQKYRAFVDFLNKLGQGGGGKRGGGGGKLGGGFGGGFAW